ncbi:hypothetical protein [Clostridium cylindrosporum]|uniref:Uncharacterized protein n=1 Tax=Clostridium cylindrosporum DSM 605 TaxID=1121307 RepID=A0A0J8D9X8_CLOCY|nr:hypothetical protein [Clostridium cylindrosporum]KMT22647.1 hypothetical protein CLCY_9c00780 [Clostridium cylindrosporum DSM 605]
MIQNIVTYAGQILITIYHKGFDSDIRSRNIKKIRKIGKYNLIFEEKVVPDNIVDTVIGWTWKFEGLLQVDEDKNPYSGSVCAYIQEYVYLNKPNKIFSIKDDKYSLKIPIEQFKEINKFVKKYTGLNIEKNPMCYGNILLYDSHIGLYHAKQEEGIVVKELNSNTIVIVKFIKDKMVVSTKIVNVTQYTKELEIISDRKWDCHDIEIYKDNELIYINKNVSYIRRIQLNMNIIGQSKKVKLNKLLEEFVIKGESSEQVSIIGDEIDELENLYIKSNYSIGNRLKQEIDDNMVVFISPGELNKAMNIITNVLGSDYDAIWIFDPYFTDNQKITHIMDWMRIITHSNINSKNINIAFFCKNKEKAYGVKEMIEFIKEDSVIIDVLKKKESLGIHFYQTKAPIHDRFIITSKGDEYSGIAIGTSFNSLGENHYCIHKLTHIASKNIWSNLKVWLEDGNIIDSGEI